MGIISRFPGGGGGATTSTIEVTCMAQGDNVTATNGTDTVTGTAGVNAKAVLTVSSFGEWTIYVNTFYWGKTTVDWVGETYAVNVPRFGFKIDINDSNPATRVSYLFDAEGLTPAAMNFESGSTFNYGGWSDFMAVKGNYPVMLKSDGTEDYKLDPDDYTKKEDGVTASDVANTSYDGNAMSVFPRMWVYRYEDADYRYCIFCPIQYDANYRADAFINHDGNCMEKFYMPCFKGSLISNKLRSIKEQTPNNATTATAEETAAEANNPSGTSLWTIIPWSRKAYLNDLLVLIGKSTDTQAVFGMGSVKHGSATAALCATGTLSDKGQFWGSSNSGKIQVKVFHCEGVWGDRWERIIGFVNDNGAIKVKMSPPYSLTNFAAYTNAGITPAGTSAGYVGATKMSALGNIPVTASGSATAYETDGMWFNNAAVAIPLVGCACSLGYAAPLSGAFAFSVSDAASIADWTIGASPSCDMPS